MLQFILFFLIITNLIVSLTKKNSKSLVIISSIFVALVFAGSREMSDWQSYYNDYIYGDEHYEKNGQVGYYIIVQISKFVGLSFDGYRLWISIIFLFFYNRFIFRFSPKPNFVWATYLSYLMFLDDVQIRNFLASAILICGISIIIEHHGRWKLKYFLIIVIASLIHNSFWIYLLYLFIPKDLNDDSLVMKIGFIGLIMTVISVIIRPFISNIVLLFSIVVGDKAVGYAETEIGLGGLIYVCLQLLAVSCIYYIIRVNQRNQKLFKKKSTIKSEKILKTILLIDILSFILLPTVILALTFNRLIRNLFIMNIVAFTIGISEKKTRILSTMVSIAYTTVFIYFDLMTSMGQRIIIEPFFNNNIYF